MSKYKGIVCKGDFALGTACGVCEKCLSQKPVTISKEEAFRKVYTEGCTVGEIVRLMESDSEGEYKFMQTRQAWLWFSDGWDARGESYEKSDPNAKLRREVASMAKENEDLEREIGELEEE